MDFWIENNSDAGEDYDGEDDDEDYNDLNGDVLMRFLSASDDSPEATLYSLISSAIKPSTHWRTHRNKHTHTHIHI